MSWGEEGGKVGLREAVRQSVILGLRSKSQGRMREDDDGGKGRLMDEDAASARGRRDAGAVKESVSPVEM